MPRYFLHLTDGQKTVTEDEPQGVDVPGDAAAIEEAEMLARGLKQGRLMPGRKWDDWFIKIVDEQGREVDTLAIADVPQV
jgi:hypothetical protein